MFYILLNVLCTIGLGQFSKTIVITDNSTSNIQSRSTRIYSDPNRDACLCDMTINLCDPLCCCDSKCSTTLIDEWSIDGFCSNSISKLNYFYPECGSFFNSQHQLDGKYHFNQINDIMCTAIQRLPYAGVFANLDDSTTVTNTQVGFDSSLLYLFQLYENPQTIDPTLIQYSGNPGYIKGKPLMVGQSNGDGMNLQWFESLKIYAWNSDGYCRTISDTTISSSSTFKIINFGEDAVLQCSLQDIDISTYCTGSNNYEIHNAFNNTSQYYYVGKWGSSNNNRSKEWTQIYQTSVSEVSGTCNRPITQQLTVQYQKVGFTGDLQNTIISVNITDLPFNYSNYGSNSVQLTLQIKYLELIASEIDTTIQNSFLDTITPYVKKIFLPFTYSKIQTIAILILLILI